MNVVAPCSTDGNRSPQPQGCGTISGPQPLLSPALPALVSQPDSVSTSHGRLCLYPSQPAFGTHWREGFSQTRNARNFRPSCLAGSGARARLDPGGGSVQQSREGSRSGGSGGGGRWGGGMGRWRLTLRVRAISLMVSSGRKLWLRYPSFLLSSPDLPPWVGKAREAWVELSVKKPIQKMPFIAGQSSLAGICLWGAGSNVQ